MVYSPRTVAEVIPNLNRDILLPGFQREFEWSEDQCIALFDSMMRNFANGELFAWMVSRSDLDDEFPIYEFVQRYITDSRHPSEFTQTFHNPKVDTSFGNVPEDLSLIVDGQQRLTTLFIGLEGSYTTKKKHKNYEKAESWTERHLVLNVGEYETGDGYGEKYDFQFRDVPKGEGPFWVEMPPRDSSEDDSDEHPSLSIDEHPPTVWFKLRFWKELQAEGSVQPLANQVEQTLVEEGYAAEDLSRYWQRAFEVLTTLQNALYQKPFLVFKEDHNPNSERIHEQFIRLNTGGENLKFESKLMSNLSQGWLYGDNPIDAREEILTKLDELNDSYGESFQFDLSFLMQCLFAFCGRYTEVNSDHISKEDMELTKSVWLDDRFIKSITRAVDLLTEFGLDDQSVSSNFVLIPVAYWLYQNPRANTERGSRAGVKNRSQVLYYIASMCINQYASKTETIRSTLALMRRVESTEFPLWDIHDNLVKQSAPLTITEDSIRGFLPKCSHKTDRKRGNARLLLSLLTYPAVVTEPNFQLDHIVPQDAFSKSALLSAGIPEDDISRYKSELRHHIGNLQLLTAEENLKKSNMPYNEWLQTRAFREAHSRRNALPRDERLYTLEQFEELLAERTERMVSHLTEKFSNLSRPETQQPVVTAD